MANLIQKTILHPENSKEVDLYPKTSYEQVEGLDGIVAGINNKIDNIPIGEKVSFIFPKKAANGNITDEQLAKLQANEANYIEMVNDKELYYLNDNGHTEGFLTYSHIGIENSKATIKTLTITVSAKSFVIVTTVVPTDAGGKLYLHSIKLHIPGLSTDATASVFVNFVTNYGKSYTTSMFQSEVIKESEITMIAAVEILGGAHFANTGGYGSIFLNFFWAGVYKCYTSGDLPYTEENVIKLHSLKTEYQDYEVSEDYVDEL